MIKFEEDRYSWSQRNEIAMRRKRSRFWQQIDWLRKQPWPVQVLFWMTYATVCYVAIVIGFLIGIGLR